MSNQKKVFNRPDRQMIITFWKWVFIVVSIFLAMYLTANEVASGNTNRYEMYMDWELRIPLVPWMIIVYFSYVAVFLLLPFVMKQARAITCLAYAFLAGTLISTVVFVLFPGELGYQRPAYVPVFDVFFQTLYEIDRPHNLFPSLHVGFSSLTALALAHQAKANWFQIAISVWAVALAASVVLVHQHHLFDILTGFLVGVLCFKFVYLKRWNER